MLKIWLLKYNFLIKMYKWHIKQMEKVAEKQIKELNNSIKYWKLGKKFDHHSQKCEDINQKINVLREKIYNKYPELRKVKEKYD